MVVRQFLCTDDAVATVSFRLSESLSSQIRLHQLLHEVHLLEVLVRRRGDDVEDGDDVLVSVVSDLIPMAASVRVERRNSGALT